MSDSSAIEWTDATWNPVTGCTKVSQGCKNCYAERDWIRLSANPKTVYYLRKFTDVAVHPDRLDAPLHWSKPRRIFVNSMSDLFHEDVPHDFIARIFATMLEARQHTFQILTKRPARMLAIMRRFVEENEEFGGELDEDVPPRNVWLGVSVEDQATANERIPLLLQTPAAVRWISAEPLLGSIDLRRIKTPSDGSLELCPGGKPMARVDWVVAGGESGPRARPSHPDWFRSLRNQCGVAHVPFFFKQWGEYYAGGERASFVSERAEVKQFLDGMIAWPVGKKAAGRVLDGRTHDEYPA